jgi:putative N6-adenine-specific DNA methylase
MAKYVAITSKGLGDVLLQEFTELGFPHAKLSGSSVRFEANKPELYRALIRTRIATRILKPILDFPAYQPDDVYHNTLKHDFTKDMSLEQTLAVESKVAEGKIRDQRIVALKVKDAIVDQFRDKFGERPNVNTDHPDMVVFIRGSKNQFMMSLDMVGETLSNRGYRLLAGEAPLRETVAAGLLRLANWDGHTPLVDPFCGSGTIVIEAALLAQKYGPGLLKKKFAVQRLAGFDEKSWQQEVKTVRDHNQSELQKWQSTKKKPWIFGFDKDRDVIRKARENAARAGVSDWVHFEVADACEVPPPAANGVIITNPPYGLRLGDVAEAKELFHAWSQNLKRNYQGWSAWILSGDKDATSGLHLKANKKHMVFNGNLECRFLEYRLF